MTPKQRAYALAAERGVEIQPDYATESWCMGKLWEVELVDAGSWRFAGVRHREGFTIGAERDDRARTLWRLACEALSAMVKA